MKKLLFVLVGALAGCGSDGDTVTVSLATSAEIKAFLEGKTLTMEGANIPTHPNGYNENVNLAQATQCYNKTVITIGADVWHVASNIGTLNGAATAGAVGTCDRTTVSKTASFDSLTTSIANVEGNGTCFDLTVTYTGFSQEGRAAFNADASQLTMELFFGGQASGHRCADGDVGASGVTLTVGGVASAFTGNAKQVYVIK